MGVLPGAEPISADGNDVCVVLSPGLTARPGPVPTPDHDAVVIQTPAVV